MMSQHFHHRKLVSAESPGSPYVSLADRSEVRPINKADLVSCCATLYADPQNAAKATEEQESHPQYSQSQSFLLPGCSDL